MEEIERYEYGILKALQDPSASRPEKHQLVRAVGFDFSLSLDTNSRLFEDAFNRLIQKACISYGRDYPHYCYMLDKGKLYFKQLRSKRGEMKQSEKLDLILQYLYDRKDDGMNYGIKEIMSDIGIYSNDIEANRLAYRLKDQGLIHPTFTIGYTEMHISTYGIDYCEETSFTVPGTSLISLHMGDINNSNFLFNSGSISRSPITQTTKHTDDEISLLIARIKAALREVEDQKAREELSEGLQEVESKIQKKEKVPLLMWDAIVKRAVDFAQIAGPVLQLAQVYGYIPKT